MSPSHCYLPTPQASRLLSRLCKHFSHKITAHWDEHRGDLIFSIGHCQLLADAQGLSLTCTADNTADLLEVQDVMQRHLKGFLAQDELVLVWTEAGKE